MLSRYRMGSFEQRRRDLWNCDSTFSIGDFASNRESYRYSGICTQPITVEVQDETIDDDPPIGGLSCYVEKYRFCVADFMYAKTAGSTAALASGFWNLKQATGPASTHMLFLLRQLKNL